MSTDLVVKTSEPVGVITGEFGERQVRGFTSDELVTINQNFPRTLSLGDFLTFCAAARASGLNPIAKEIYPIPYKEDGRAHMVIQTSIEGYRKMGNKGFRGLINPVLRVKNKEGESLSIPHAEYDPEEHVRIISATLEIRAEGFPDPVKATAVFKEYCKVKDGKPSGLWKAMPSGQIMKCAEALAYRKAGLIARKGSAPIYVDAEMDQAAIDVSFSRVEPETSTINPEDLQPGNPDEHTDVRGPVVTPEAPAPAAKTTKVGACEKYIIQLFEGWNEEYDFNPTAEAAANRFMQEQSVFYEQMSDKTLPTLKNFVATDLVAHLQEAGFLPKEGPIKL